MSKSRKEKNILQFYADDTLCYTLLFWRGVAASLWKSWSSVCPKCNHSSWRQVASASFVASLKVAVARSRTWQDLMPVAANQSSSSVSSESQPDRPFWSIAHLQRVTLLIGFAADKPFTPEAAVHIHPPNIWPASANQYQINRRGKKRRERNKKGEEKKAAVGTAPPPPHCDWYVINFPHCSGDATLKEPARVISRSLMKVLFGCGHSGGRESGNDNDGNNNNNSKNSNDVFFICQRLKWDANKKDSENLDWIESRLNENTIQGVVGGQSGMWPWRAN